MACGHDMRPQSSLQRNEGHSMNQQDVKQRPSRKRFIDHQQPKTAQRPATYLTELLQRIESLTAAVADTGRVSHAKRASLENQLKQAVANLDAHKAAPKKADERD
jgi:hypothetical protein